MELFTIQNGSLHYKDYNLKDVLDRLYNTDTIHTVLPTNALEEWWYYYATKLGDLNMFLAFYTLMNTCYCLGGLFFFAIDKSHLLDKYKIQPDKYATREDYIKCIKNILTNYVLIIYPLIYIAFPILKYLNFKMALPLPTVATWLWQMAFCIIVEDIAHYWLHRFLHIKWLYPKIHKVHHTFAAPFGLTASYAHWAEVIILALPTFLGPMMIPGCHNFTFFSFLLFRQMDAVVTHCGYDLPNLFDFIPYFGGTVPHDYHHKSFIFNYSSRFTFMDKLCGTYKMPPSHKIQHKD